MPATVDAAISDRELWRTGSSCPAAPRTHRHHPRKAVTMKKPWSVTSAYKRALKNTYANNAQPTSVVHHMCTLLRAARRIDAALKALAAISTGFKIDMFGQMRHRAQTSAVAGRFDSPLRSKYTP